jgi:hypothetical protein
MISDELLDEISCAWATCCSAVSASGASVKSTNLAGCLWMRLSRHW